MCWEDISGSVEGGSVPGREEGVERQKEVWRYRYV